MVVGYSFDADVKEMYELETVYPIGHRYYERFKYDRLAGRYCDCGNNSFMPIDWDPLYPKRNVT